MGAYLKKLMLGSTSAVIATLLLFCLSLSAQEIVTRNEGESLSAFSKRILPEGSEFAHPPAQVKFGPAANNVVVLFRTGDVNENFTGWILVPEHPSGRSYKKYVLPPMFEAPNSFMIEVRAVFGAQVGASTKRDLVILYEYQKSGHPQDSGHGAYVYHWDGKQFEIRDKLWEVLAGLKTAAAVRQKLHAQRNE